MRAVLIATGSGADLGALAEQFNAVMLPVLDRPVIQHVVEALVDRGIKEIDVVLNHQAHQVEELLGEGNRWGILIRYHLARDASRPYRALKTMPELDERETILVGRADTLPRFDRLRPPTESECPVFYGVNTSGESDGVIDWSGWVWLSEDEIDSIPSDADDAAFVDALCGGRPPTHVLETTISIASREFASLLASNLAAAEGRVPGLMRGGFEVDPGIRLSRNVSLHPTARLIAPVFLGEDCRIGEGVTVGPGAVVGSGCIVDRRAAISGSVLFSGSYVGQGIELTESVVVRNHLVDIRNQTEIHIEDDLLLASVSPKSIWTGVAALLSRMSAVLTLIVCSPILLLTSVGLTLAGRHPIFVSTEAVQLPASPDEERRRTYRLWRFNADDLARRWGGIGDLLFRFLPGVFNVARGELRFVGVPPRSVDQIRRLPHDWRVLYIKAKAGLITESTLTGSQAFEAEDKQFAEAYYSVSSGLSLDLRLLLSYFRRALFTRGAPPAKAAPGQHRHALSSITLGRLQSGFAVPRQTTPERTVFVGGPK